MKLRWFGRRAAGGAGVRRWTIVDVETTGLDPQRDRLLAIAAVALRLDGDAAPRIVPGDSFEVVLHGGATASIDRANILLHGIGVQAQAGGMPAGEALTAFVRWVGDAPLLGFHVGFDAAVIQRALRLTGHGPMPNTWLDIAPLAEVLHPIGEGGGHSLDDWLQRFDIPCAQRHQAACDVLATAELLLRLWPAARRQTGGAPDLGALRRLASSRRWLG